MANNLFISYDLHEPGKNYEAVIAEIKKLGSWAKVHYSLWYVKTPLSAEQAAKRVWAVMDTNDKLIVIDTTNDTCYWYNLSNEVAEHLKKSWRALV
jgi:dTDP-4-dehydrorhamnose reductase